MKYPILRPWLICCLMYVCHMLNAQSNTNFYYFDPYVSYELSKVSVGVGGGLNLFNNDLHQLLERGSQNSFMNFHGTVDVSYRLTNYLSLRGGASVYQLYGQPSINAAAPFILDVKPAVKSSNIEAYLAIVHDLFSKEKIERGKISWNIYAFGGAGMTAFEPRHAITGEKLRPSEEEVELYEYAYASPMPIFPVGLGFAYYFNDHQSIALEASNRFSTSDWMDHAYWKGSKKRDFDGYMFIGFRFQHAFLAGGNGRFNYKGYRKRANKKR